MGAMTSTIDIRDIRPRDIVHSAKTNTKIITPNNVHAIDKTPPKAEKEKSKYCIIKVKLITLANA